MTASTGLSHLVLQVARLTRRSASSSKAGLRADLGQVRLVKGPNQANKVGQSAEPSQASKARQRAKPSQQGQPKGWHQVISPDQLQSSSWFTTLRNFEHPRLRAEHITRQYQSDLSSKILPSCPLSDSHR